MDKIDLLYDHYKETLTTLYAKIKQRDRIFIITGILLLIHLLLAVNPNEYGGFIIKIINEKFSLDISNYIMVIHTFLWIAIIYTTLRYSQSCVAIERSYQYISILELRIANIAQTNFDRESGNYLKNYPSISKITNFIYKYLFAIFAIIIASIKILMEIINEYTLKSTRSYLILIDIALYILYSIIWISHVDFMRKND